MPIERQSEQWPHRREAMLRIAAFDPAAIDSFDDDFYNGASSSPQHLKSPRWDADTRPILPLWSDPENEGPQYHFSPREVNPEADTSARPATPWYQTSTDDPVIPGMGFSHNEGEEWEYGNERQPYDLHRGFRLWLPDHSGDSSIGQVRRLLHGPALEDDSPGASWTEPYLPGMEDYTDQNLTPDLTGPGSFDHPDLPHHILNHIINSHDQQELGTHWSTDFDTAGKFAGVYPSKSMYLPQSLPVVVSGRWKGEGEDPYRRHTGGNFSDENEITLLPGAPMKIHTVRIHDPHTNKWHTHTLDEPQERTANFDPYEANDYGIQPYHDQDWDDEDDDEPMDGYIRVNDPMHLRSPLYPDGHKSRPSFSDDLDDLGGKRKIYHFSPHDFNPPSDSPARGDAFWRASDPPEGILPLEMPSSAVGGVKDRQPIPLYRGITLRLDHPDLQWIRRALHGDSREDIEDHQFNGYYFGQPHRQPYLDPSMTNRNLASPVEEGDTDILYNHDLKHRMTHTILDHMNDQKGGLGTHWGMGEDNARSFAGSGGSGGHTGPTLPVVITHHWKGTGEDPYRRGTEGEWPDEQEITHLHGAKANVAAVHVQHPHHGWMKIFDADDHGETLTHKASR
jgi:hypothetical protein